MSEQTDGLVQFATYIQQQVLTRSEREGEEEFAENVFTSLMLERLGDAGEVEDAHLCPHQAGVAAQSLKVNAWAVSGGENADECLDLFVTVHTGEIPPRTILKDEMTVAFSKLKRFAAKAFQGYHYKLEESSRIFDACQRIDEIMERITRIRFILLTDGIVKADPPVAADASMELNGKTLSYRATNQIWDLERFYRLSSSGRQQEPIEIDFVEKTGAAVPCLAQPAASAEYAAYLAIIPGSVLAYLYGEYGSPAGAERAVILASTRQDQCGHPSDNQERPTYVSGLQQRAFYDSGVSRTDGPPWGRMRPESGSGPADRQRRPDNGFHLSCAEEGQGLAGQAIRAGETDGHS